MRRGSIASPSRERPARLLQIGAEEHADAHRATEALLKGICIPGVAPLLGSGTTPDGAPYHVIPDLGQDLGRALTRRGGLSLEQAMRVCREATSILSALATAGVELPDADSRRFALDPGERPWLVDLSGARGRQVEEAKIAHLELARGLCRYVLNRARRYIPPHDILEALKDSRDCIELARVFESRASS